MAQKVNLSKTSKLDGIKSWSLQAVECCPGALKELPAYIGELVDACKGCYATTNMYLMGPVKAPRIFNKEDWKREDWVADMVFTLQKDKYFRWFDSGDSYSLKLAKKMLQVMEQTPNTQHWFPTRMMKFAKFAEIFAKMQALPNVMVRFSSDSIVGEYTPGLHGSTILNTEEVPEGVVLCTAYQHEGKCNGCRACYNKDVAVIGYPAHGFKMKKVITLKLAA